MAVPAHDTRDYEFAKKFNIPVIPVLDGGDIEKEAFTGDGLHINSGFLNGLNKKQAIDKMSEWLESNGCGKKTTTYKRQYRAFGRCGAPPYPARNDRLQGPRRSGSLRQRKRLGQR